MRAIVWISKPLPRSCAALLPDAMVVSTMREFLDAPRDAKTVSFVDDATLANLDGLAAELGASTAEAPPEWRKLLAAVSLGPVIACCKQPVATAMGWFAPHPWLAHVISTPMLNHELGERHLASVISILNASGELKLMDVMRPTPEGRQVRLNHSSRRGQRLERITEFYRSKGVGSSTIDQLHDIADRLLVNAFYDAPAAAGVEAPRNKDVALPDDLACDMVYGCHDDIAFVRVRDPFGSLTRQRLVDSLSLSGRDGPSSSLRQVFAGASVVAISVVTNRHTEILVEIPTGPAKPGMFAFHLFFRAGAKRGVWKALDEDTGDPRTQSETVSVVFVD